MIDGPLQYDAAVMADVAKSESAELTGSWPRDRVHLPGSEHR